MINDHILAKLLTRNGVDYFVCGASAKMRSNGIRDDYPGLEYAEDEFRGFFIVELSPDSLEYSIISDAGAVRYRGSVPLAPRSPRSGDLSIDRVSLRPPGRVAVTCSAVESRMMVGKGRVE